MQVLSRHSLTAIGRILTLFAERATFCGVFGLRRGPVVVGLAS